VKISLRKPETHAGATAAKLVDNGVMARVRPFYHKESETGSGFDSARARFTYVGDVVDTYGPDMVIVRLLSNDGPWNRTAAYYPRELHTVWCKCNGCNGTGINEERGA
jgi:hypothetical protein